MSGDGTKPKQSMSVPSTTDEHENEGSERLVATGGNTCDNNAKTLDNASLDPGGDSIGIDAIVQSWHNIHDAAVCVLVVDQKVTDLLTRMVAYKYFKNNNTKEELTQWNNKKSGDIHNRDDVAAKFEIWDFFSGVQQFKLRKPQKLGNRWKRKEKVKTRRYQKKQKRWGRRKKRIKRRKPRSNAKGKKLSKLPRTGNRWKSKVKRRRNHMKNRRKAKRRKLWTFWYILKAMSTDKKRVILDAFGEAVQRLLIKEDDYDILNEDLQHQLQALKDDNEPTKISEIPEIQPEEDKINRFLVFSKNKVVCDSVNQVLIKFTLQSAHYSAINFNKTLVGLYGTNWKPNVTKCKDNERYNQLSDQQKGQWDWVEGMRRMRNIVVHERFKFKSKEERREFLMKYRSFIDKLDFSTYLPLTEKETRNRYLLYSGMTETQQAVIRDTYDGFADEYSHLVPEVRQLREEKNTLQEEKNTIVEQAQRQKELFLYFILLFCVAASMFETLSFNGIA